MMLYLKFTTINIVNFFKYINQNELLIIMISNQFILKNKIKMKNFIKYYQKNLKKKIMIYSFINILNLIYYQF